MPRRRPLTLLLIAAALTLLVLAGLTILNPGGHRITGRVYIDGLFMGGWTRQAAARALAQRAEAYLSSPVTLYHHGQCWQFCPLETGVSIDWTEPLAEALAPGQRGWAGARLLGFAAALWRPKRLDLRVRIAKEQLIALLSKEIAAKVERQPCNAQYDPDKGAILAARSGWEIDYEATGRNLCRATLKKSGRRAVLVVVEVAPATSSQDLAALSVRRVIASFRTTLSGSAPDRLANIVRGASRLNGTLLHPGGVFSFNKVIGPRDAAHGYRPALEIVRQELVPGIGGGICQVASTLYNAVLLAGLPVLERHCHALPPGYVPLGRDATVYYPNLDFRFGNGTGGHLLILAQVERGVLRVILIGEKGPTEQVSVVARVLAKLDPPLVEPTDPRATRNPAGAPGYRVLVTRLYGNPEDPARVETVSEDIYHPVPRLLGTEAVAPKRAAVSPPGATGRRTSRTAPPNIEDNAPEVAVDTRARNVPIE